MTNEFERDLDVRGLNCPLPILKTKKELVRMEPGERLRVRATDPHAVIDFMAFCDKTGHALERHEEIDAEYHFVVRKQG